MSVSARTFASQPMPTADSSASANLVGACLLLDAVERRAISSFSQLEKLLMIVAFDPAFAERLISYGESAKTRYAFEHDEGQLLDRLLSSRGAGIRAIQNVFRAMIDTRESIRAQQMQASWLGATTRVPSDEHMAGQAR
jgi:hypothetical protein